MCESSVYPQTKWACGSNLATSALKLTPYWVIVMSAIDNNQRDKQVKQSNDLMMMGWDEKLGLPHLGFYQQEWGTEEDRQENSPCPLIFTHGP